MSKREHSIDVLRIISAFAVVVIHAVSAPVSNYSGALSETVSANLNTIHALMKWSVPVFFMITGYCLSKKDACTYDYCFSHVKKYLAVLFTVGLFYAMLEVVYTTKAISVNGLLCSIKNVISGSLWDHMWFVYSIIGVYLVMPVIHAFTKQSVKNAAIITTLLFFFTILCPFCKEWIPVGVDFPFGGYLFYVCFGMLAEKCRPHKKWRYVFFAVCALCILYIVLCPSKKELHYLHPVISVFSMAVFLLVSRLEIRGSKGIEVTSACTWGIYLIHPFFINVIIKAFKIDLLSQCPYGKISLFAILIFGLSFAVTYLLKRMPLIKYLF